VESYWKRVAAAEIDLAFAVLGSFAQSSGSAAQRLAAEVGWTAAAQIAAFAVATEPEDSVVVVREVELVAETGTDFGIASRSSAVTKLEVENTAAVAVADACLGHQQMAAVVELS